MTNVIFKVAVVGKPCQPLLLRIYGNCIVQIRPFSIGTDIFMNRETEINYFQILSNNNFGVQLIKIFPGGRVEVWREGYNVRVVLGVKRSHSLHRRCERRGFPSRLRRQWQ